MTTPLELSRALRDITGAAADLYAATNDPAALFAAASLRANLAEALATEVSEALPSGSSLIQALAAQPDSHLSQLLRLHAACAPWTEGRFEMPGCFAGRYAFVELMGPEGLARSPALRFGLYLQEPGTYYPPHSHAAEEYYFVLSGSARWQIDDGAWFETSTGSFIHHSTWQRHAMETGDEPLFAMWVWTGDLDTDHYQVDGGQIYLHA